MRSSLPNDITYDSRPQPVASPLRQAQVLALSLHVRHDFDHRHINGSPEPWWCDCGISRGELDEVISLAVAQGLVRVEVQRTSIGAHTPVVLPTEVDLPEAPPHLWAWQQRAQAEASA